MTHRQAGEPHADVGARAGHGEGRLVLARHRVCHAHCVRQVGDLGEQLVHLTRLLDAGRVIAGVGGRDERHVRGEHRQVAAQLGGEIGVEHGNSGGEGVG